MFGLRRVLAPRPSLPLRSSCRTTTPRPFTLSATTSVYPADFEFMSNFFSIEEQCTLLSASLRKLDVMEPRSMRRRRKDFLASRTRPGGQDNLTADAHFFPDEYYQFEEGHFDGVIKRYREMHVSSWDEADSPALCATLQRLRAIYPTKSETQTHLLHLASDGEILPHVDNVGASGSWILGVSLGATRTMRLESDEDAGDTFNIQLPAGSVYVQRDTVRYRYKHSILLGSTPSGQASNGSQRLSIMVRDRLPLNSKAFSL